LTDSLGTYLLTVNISWITWIHANYIRSFRLAEPAEFGGRYI
jgi:hypothetical protein